LLNANIYTNNNGTQYFISQSPDCSTAAAIIFNKRPHNAQHDLITKVLSIQL